MGDGQRALARRARARDEARKLLEPLESLDLGIDGLIQCGLGDWAEGPVLIEKFPGVNFLAVDPIHRYAHEAWRDGFRGPIIQGLLWSETGKMIELNDFRSRTSVLDKEQRFLGKFNTYTVTLDDACRFVNFQACRILLWMDCEGSELEILKGAPDTLMRTTAIICELKDKPAFEGWPKSDEVLGTMEDIGFKFHSKVSDNGLFLFS